MKNLWIVLLVVGMLLMTLTACQGNTPQETKAAEQPTAQVTAAPTAEATATPEAGPTEAPQHNQYKLTTAYKYDKAEEQEPKENADGTYYYETLIDSSMAWAVNVSFKRDADVELETAAVKAVMDQRKTNDDVKSEKDEAFSAKLGQEVYRATWTAGGNEDTTQYTALYFELSDGYGFAYAAGGMIDYYDEYEAGFKAAFDGLTLEKLPTP